MEQTHSLFNKESYPLGLVVLHVASCSVKRGYMYPLGHTLYPFSLFGL